MTTSSEVKSGLRKLSFSKEAGQGRRGRSPSAAVTRLPNLALMALLTIATKPSRVQRSWGQQDRECSDYGAMDFVTSVSST